MEQDNNMQQVENSDGHPHGDTASESHHHHTHSSQGHDAHHTHSHHGKHRSSHRRRHGRGKKKSLFDRIQSWFDKTFSRRSMLIIVIAMLLVFALLLGVMYFVENKPKDPGVSGDYGELTGEQESGSASSSSSNATATVTATVAIPAYWEDMIAEKTARVKLLQTAGGKDCVSFAWASDTHIPDNSTARTNDLGKIMAKMMDNCDMPFAVITGDVGTRASLDTETDLVNAQAQMSVHLAPLWGTDRLLVALGNHDGCYGDSSCYYKKQFSPEKMWQVYFRNQALDARRKFSDDGLYYFVDNEAQKTRFIVLNSHFAGEYLADGNGLAINNRFEVSCYGQEQLDWLANVALDMPEGYGAVIMAHVPPKVLYETHTVPYTVDCEQLCGIINAYNGKSTFAGSYTDGVDGWSNSDINVDFSDAKGEIIAMFTGHVHHDSIDTTTLSCPLITIISAGASVNLGENPERTFYTDQETSFDVVTINRKTRTIYLTRVGAGEDRSVQY